VQVLFYSQAILGLGYVEINIKCDGIGIEMKEKIADSIWTNSDSDYIFGFLDN